MKDKNSLCICRNPDNNTSLACNRKMNTGSICHLESCSEENSINTFSGFFFSVTQMKMNNIDFHFLIFLCFMRYFILELCVVSCSQKVF